MIVLAAPLSAYAEDDAATIVDKAIKAKGGLEKLSKGKAEEWKSKGKIDLMGMKLEYTGEYYYQLPGNYRFNATMDFGGNKFVISAGTDGKSIWQQAMNQVEEMPMKKADAFRQRVYGMTLTTLLPLKDKDLTLAVVNGVKIDDKPTVGIKVSKKGQKDVTLYFDKESYLLAKSETITWNEFTDKDVPQEVFFKGWKDKDGLKIFDKLVIKLDGKDFIEEELSDQKFLDKLDSKLFTKP
jgi:hypothetical protein